MGLKDGGMVDSRRVGLPPPYSEVKHLGAAKIPFLMDGAASMQISHLGIRAVNVGRIIVYPSCPKLLVNTNTHATHALLPYVEPRSHVRTELATTFIY